MVKPFTLAGILAAVPGGGVQTLIPQGDGTALGNATSAGGLGASFDGNNDQVDTDSSKAVSVTTLFIGKYWGAGVTHTVTGFKIWGTNNKGYVGGTYIGDVKGTLQGSSDNFSADINDLGNTGNFGEVNNSNPQEVMSGLDESTAYRYHRVKLDKITGGTKNMWTAEVEFYETI